MVTSMETINQRALFDSAAQHMNHDRALFDQKPDCLVHYYRWPIPSVTYTYKQALPEDLAPIDHAQRYTGGGMVFHCPGDIVVCYVAALDHSDFPKKLKDKVVVAQRHIAAALTDCGVSAQVNPNPGPRNLMFCQAYHSPYELYYQGDKIVALSLRCNRTHFMIQGIIHMQPTHHWFDLPSAYSPVSVSGLPQVDSDAVLARLWR